MSTVDPNAWTVVNLAHFTTGQTINPDDQTGDEWHVIRTNPTIPGAEFSTVYGVTARPVDEDGERVDPWQIVDIDAHPYWRYSVDEVTEYVVGTNPEDPWGTEVWSDHEYGEGSFLDYETEEEADRACEQMARRDAAMTDIITWDGQPFTR